MRLHEKLYRESLEREDGGIENDAQRDNQPITHAKLPQISEDYFVGGNLPKVVVLFGPRLHEPINDRAHKAEGREGQCDQEGSSPVGVSGASPSRRVERGESTQAGCRQVQAERKA